MRSSRIFLVFSLGSILSGITLYGLFASNSLNIFTNTGNNQDTDSAVGTSSDSKTNYYGNAINQAKDAKMMADLKGIQTALELYYYENGSYPEELSILTQEGYLSSIPINTVILDYQRPGPDSYTLTTNLSNGEKYTLSSEY